MQLARSIFEDLGTDEYDICHVYLNLTEFNTAPLTHNLINSVYYGSTEISFYISSGTSIKHYPPPSLVIWL
jgi:hypothetical protein